MKIWKVFCTAMTIAGMVLLVLGVSTSDYYVIELGVREPDYVSKMLLAGGLCFIPSVIDIFLAPRRENNKYMEGEE